jgi:tetratricopeptide (TPR) repeat protein
MSSLAPGARQRPIDTWVLGQAYQQAGQLRQAVAIWQSQAARPLLVSTGWQAMEAQEFEVAVQAFRAACETDPVNTALPLALAHIGMGKALYQNGYGAEAALQETENAVTILPTEISGYLAMGDLLREEKRYVEANGWYRRAADLFPGDSRPWTRWGESAIRQQNYALATQVLEQAAGKLPNSAAVFYTLANAYFDAGDFARAEAAANKAVALAPDESAWYWIVTGRIHEKLNRSDKALAAYRRALQIDPNNLVARDGSTRLAAQP